MKRRILALLLAGMICGMAVGCAGPGGPTGDTTTGTGNTTGAPDTGTRPQDPVEPTYVKQYPYTDEEGVLHIRYQDTYRFENRIAEIADTVITSRVCGSDQPDSELLRQLDDQTVYAAGCGTATVRFRQGEQKIVVDPSPINLLLVSGQSNASGDWSFYGTDRVDLQQTYGEYYIRSAPTMAYMTFTSQGLSLNDTGYNAPEAFVTDTLNWEAPRSNVSGCDPRFLTDPDSRFGNAGWCAGLAYEWTERTGERVWIVNASHGGMPISTFLPSEDGTVVDNDYYQAVAVFRLALDTLKREEEAGHFTLNHFGYYWFQGESDSSRDDTYYLTQFAKVHEGFQRDVVYEYAGERRTLEFCGIMTLRSCQDSVGNSLAELYMTGPRLAQYQMGDAAEDVFDNVFIASNVTEKWVGGNENVETYFLERYGSADAFEEIFGYSMPYTMFELHPNIHYLMKGHNEMGVDAGRNTLLYLNREHPESSYRLPYGPDTPTVRLLAVDGYTEITDMLTVDMVSMSGYLCPRVEPAYMASAGLTLSCTTPGVRIDGYRLICEDPSVRSAEIRVLLDGEEIRCYTLEIRVQSSLSANLPTYSKAVDGSYSLDEGWEENSWKLGYLTYATGVFTPFRQIEENGWLYDGVQLWGGRGGFFATDSWKAGIPNRRDMGLAASYTVSGSGVLGISADMLLPNLNNTYFAVFLNGDMIFPTEGGTPGSSSDWYTIHAGTDATDAATLNEALAELQIAVESGDELCSTLTQFGEGVGQVILYPTVWYLEEE